MQRIIVITSIVLIALAGTAGTANADDAQPDRAAGGAAAPPAAEPGVDLEQPVDDGVDADATAAQAADATGGAESSPTTAEPSAEPAAASTADPVETAGAQPGLFAQESVPIPDVLDETADAGVTLGDDGRFYYSMAPVTGGTQSSSQIGRVDSDWTFTWVDVANTNVVDLAAGTGAGVWFTNSTTMPSVGRWVPGADSGADPAPMVLESFPVPADQPPFGITMGGDANLWVSIALAATPRIGRMTPTGEYTGFGVPASIADPTGIVTGWDGTTFWTDGGLDGRGHIGNTSLDGATTTFPVAPLVDPTQPAIGPHGNIWFTSPSCTSCYRAQTTNRIGRMTPDGTLTGNFFVSDDDAAFFGITLGPDGNLWFSQRSLSSDPQPNAIGRITPDGIVTLFSVDAAPGGIAGDRDGRVWWVSYNTATQTWEISRMVVARADLSLTKTVRSAAYNAGATILFDLVATNHGPTDAGNVVVTDTLPNGLVYVGAANAGMWRCAADRTETIVTCSLGRLANGSSSGFTLITRLLRALEPGADLVNTARISSSAQDPDPDNNIATAVVRNPGAPPSPTPRPSRAALPFTGTSHGILLVVALMLVAAGLLTRTLARRVRATI